MQLPWPLTPVHLSFLTPAAKLCIAVLHVHNSCHNTCQICICVCAALQSTFPRVPITAVTATATAQVQQDIKSILGISSSAAVHQVNIQGAGLMQTRLHNLRFRWYSKCRRVMLSCSHPMLFSMVYFINYSAV
jgi:hypothetical protein